ncbi:MAG: hypothetical protein ACLFSB_08880 [Chitinispirillaceae bacterium]
MHTSLKNQRGSALIYGLVALFAASLTGLGLIQLSRGDKMTSVEFTKMRSSSVAAKAALQAYEKKCAQEPQLVVDLLNKYITDSIHQWLLVSDTNSSATEQRILMDSSLSQSPKIALRVLAFDPVEALLHVEAFGYAGRNSREKVSGYYHLRGTGPENYYGHEYSMYMGGEGKNFDSPVSIDGDVFFDADVHFNSGASGSVIQGNFQTGSSIDSSTFNCNLTINGKAYFQTPVKTQNGQLRINGKSGFEQWIYSDDHDIELHDDGFFNGDIIGNEEVDMNNNDLTHSGGLNTSMIDDADDIHDNGGTIDIPAELGLSDSNPPPFGIDLSVIPPSKIHSTSSLSLQWGVSAWDVEVAYNAVSAANDLWNGFMVVRTDGNMSMDASLWPTSARVIWIIDHTVWCNGRWYKTTSGTNTLVYVRPGGNISGFGGEDFRGYVHVAGSASDSAEMTYSWSAADTIKGAIHHVNQYTKFQHNTGHLNLIYDQSVIEEFADPGLVSIPLPPDYVPKVVLTDTRIRPSLIGVHY